FNEQLTELSRAFAAVALGGVADKESLPWNSKIGQNINYRAAGETLTAKSAGNLDILSAAEACRLQPGRYCAGPVGPAARRPPRAFGLPASFRAVPRCARGPSTAGPTSAHDRRHPTVGP